MLATVNMPDDFNFIYFQGHLLETARQDFAQFYLTASGEDADLMDELILAHAALDVGMNTPREHIAPYIRDHLERVTDATERIFTELREKVRACPAFVALIAAEQTQIERVIFSVRPARRKLTPLQSRNRPSGWLGE